MEFSFGWLYNFMDIDDKISKISFDSLNVIHSRSATDILHSETKWETILQYCQSMNWLLNKWDILQFYKSYYEKHKLVPSFTRIVSALFTVSCCMTVIIIISHPIMGDNDLRITSGGSISIALAWSAGCYKFASSGMLHVVDSSETLCPKFT